MTNQFTASQLLQESGTIPFRGFTEADNVAHEYPDELPVAGEQFDEDATWFLDALEVLPRAGKGQLIANNQFVKERDDGSVSVDVEEIQQVHGLDIDTIEEITGQSLESLGREAESHALPQIPVSGYKEIIDRRRLALRTLFDISCRYRFQISSSSYEAGDMLHLLGKKANTKYNDVFGWIRFRDYGGDVTITTIYSDINTEGVLSEIPDDVAIDFNEEQFRVGDGEGEQAIQMVGADEDSAGDESGGFSDDVFSFGEQISWNFHGTQKISAEPVVFQPTKGVAIPVPTSTEDFSFDRRHEGDFMDTAHERDNGRLSPLEWHNAILNELEDLTQSIGANIIRAKIASLNFGALPYDVADFFDYLGMPRTYAEKAAERVEKINRDGGAVTPSLWTLQLALKLTLLDEFQGEKASDRFRELEEIAGQLLQYPVQQIQIANTEHNHRIEAEDDDETTLAPSQQTIAESLSDLQEVPGVITDELDLAESQQVQMKVQSTLEEVDAGSA